MRNLARQICGSIATLSERNASGAPAQRKVLDNGSCECLGRAFQFHHQSPHDSPHKVYTVGNGHPQL